VLEPRLRAAAQRPAAPREHNVHVVRLGTDDLYGSRRGRGDLHERTRARRIDPGEVHGSRRGAADRHCHAPHEQRHDGLRLIVVGGRGYRDQHRRS
jgi:hypothetical protein